MDGRHPINLTRDEQEELLKACNSFPCDEKVRAIAGQYLAEYKLHSHVRGISMQGNSERGMPVLARCALYLAEKSQPLRDVKGDRITSPPLSLNQIIKTFGSAEQFVGGLKDLLKNVRLQDRQVEAEANQSIKRISFGVTFHSKFEKTIRKLQLTQKVSESYGYTKTFTSFMWLLFIDARSRIYGCNQDLVENTCLLASVFYFMIRYSLGYVRPLLFSDVEREQDKKTLISCITEKLLELFSIEDLETYRNVVSSFDDYFDRLVQENVVKHSHEKTDFFSPELINTNYKRLDTVYQKELKLGDLDERFFLRERISTLTPSKLTPFARQGYNSKALVMRLKEKDNRQAPAPDPKEYSSHRALNYDVCEKDLQANIAKLPPQINEFKFPKNVMFSPTMARPALICATPVTMGMEMYNYLHEKPRAVKDITFKLRKHEQQAAKWIEKIVQMERRDNFESAQEKKTRETRFNITYSLYKLAVEEYYSQNCQQKESEDLHKAMIALSSETVCFVCNMVNLTFREIVDQLSVKCDVLLKANEFFTRFDKSMPLQVRSHFQDLETQMLSWDIWRDEDLITQLENYGRSDFETDGKPQTEPKDKLLKKILTQAAQQISSLGSELKLEDRLCEQVFSTVKYIIVEEADLLYGRHLDQMILCGFYAVCKTNQLNIKFIDIKMKYEECSQYNKAMHQDLIWNVDCGGAKQDIIKFYNAVFVPKLKVFITSLKDHQSSSPLRGYAPLLQLPLKQFAAGSQPYKRHMKMRSQFAPVNIDTPGPNYVLERGVIIQQPPFQSKKTLLFEDEQNNLNLNNNAVSSRTPRHYDEQYGCVQPQPQDEYNQKKPREFRDLRQAPPSASQASTSSISTVATKAKNKEVSTPRMYPYHVGDTEKMKFNK